jgi:hypothetical protein
MIGSDKKPEIGWRTRAGIAGTVAWLSLAIWWTFLWPTGSWCIPSEMEPNAWGDWAAGTFAPLAFLWLVLGYFQQGEELRESARALHLQEKALQLQVQELKESVEQQTVMARASATQAELLAKSHALALRAQLLPHQPLPKQFRLARDGLHGGTGLLIVNAGAVATSVHGSLTAVGAPEKPPTSLGDWHIGGGLSLAVDLSRAELPFRAVLVLRYTDALSIEQSQSFILAFHKNESNSLVVSASRTSMSFNLPA